MSAKNATACPLPVACFDLETSGLDANFGVVLCGVVKPQGGKAVVFRGDSYKQWTSGRRHDDSAIVRDIAAELSKYQILIAHNGARFDMPFIRSRMLRHGMPPMAKPKLIDPCSVAWSQFKLRSNSLASVAAHIGIEQEKTQVAGEIWLDAIFNGSRKSMNYIVEHCVIDVEVLEKVAQAVAPYSSQINTWGSGR